VEGKKGRKEKVEVVISLIQEKGPASPLLILGPIGGERVRGKKTRTYRDDLYAEKGKKKKKKKKESFHALGAQRPGKHRHRFTSI